MSTDGFGAGGWISVLLAFKGIQHGVRLYRYCTTRVVRPGTQDDPARTSKWLLICGVPLLAIAIVAANVWAIDKQGVQAVIPAILLDLIAAFVLIGLALWVWIAIERQRRRAGYVIAEVSYPDATSEITSSMRRINKSARTVRKGRAHQEGMFGDIGIDQLVYEAAQQAVISSELSAAIQKLRSSDEPDDQEPLFAAIARVDGISRHLQEVEASLARVAGTAKSLSEHLTRPEKERADQELASKAAAVEAQRRQRARAQLEQANVRAAVRPVTDGTAIEERVNAVHSGYEEVLGLSDAVLKGPSETIAQATKELPADVATDTDTDTDRPHAARDAAWKLTKLSADKAAKLSVAAAKAGSEKFRNRKTRD